MRLIGSPLRAAYLLALTGPASTAAAHIMLSFLLLHSLDARDFGVFSFLMITSQLTIGISNALFCAPLPLARNTSSNPAVDIAAFFSASSVFYLVVIASAFAAASLAGIETRASVLFSLYAGARVLRWFGRAYNYTFEAIKYASISDYLYGAVIVIFMPVLLYNRASLELVFSSLLLATLVSLVALRMEFFARHISGASVHSLARYADTLRNHSGWALTGVLTTEATVNAHAYLVTAVAGPHSFAILAATAILVRPVNLIANALTDYERPRLSALLANKGFEVAKRALFPFRLMLVATWSGSVTIAIGVFYVNSGIVVPDTYSLGQGVISVGLWLAIAAVRVLRAPESAILQSAGQFRALAFASYASCGFSLAAALAFLVLAGPVWSLAGVLIGETAMTLFVWQSSKSWQSRVKARELAVEDVH